MRITLKSADLFYGANFYSQMEHIINSAKWGHLATVDMNEDDVEAFNVSLNKVVSGIEAAMKKFSGGFTVHADAVTINLEYGDLSIVGDGFSVHYRIHSN